uniref:Guanine nucleotide-binding protein subunit gamma n=2 Tax=Rhinolophus ferrumequinum TaxID=59479 RepID=A0A671F4A9_RHIFE
GHLDPAPAPVALSFCPSHHLPLSIESVLPSCLPHPSLSIPPAATRSPVCAALHPCTFPWFPIAPPASSTHTPGAGCHHTTASLTWRPRLVPSLSHSRLAFNSFPAAAMSNNMAKIAEARKTVEQLKLEVNIDRLKVSQAAAELLAFCETHAKDDPLVTPVPAAENPFRDKRLFCILL